MSEQQGPVRRYRKRKRPVVVEAVRLTEGNAVAVADWVSDHGTHCDQFPERLLIGTLEGEMSAPLGWWVIRGVAGEFYPCEPKIFEAAYEPVTDGDGPVLTRCIGVTGRSGGPLTISGEAVAALADAGVVPVRQCDLAAVLAEGVVPEDARARLEQAAAWQGEAGPVPLRDDLVTVSRDDLRAALSAHLEGRAYSDEAVAAAGRLAQAAGLTS
jgi:hypothetical protein